MIASRVIEIKIQYTCGMQYKVMSMNSGCVACGGQLIPLSGSVHRETIKTYRHEKRNATRCLLCRLLFETFYAVDMALPRYLRRRMILFKTFYAFFLHNAIMRGRQYKESVMRLKIYT